MENFAETTQIVIYIAKTNNFNTQIHWAQSNILLTQQNLYPDRHTQPQPSCSTKTLKQTRIRQIFLWSTDTTYNLMWLYGQHEAVCHSFLHVRFLGLRLLLASTNLQEWDTLVVTSHNIVISITRVMKAARWTSRITITLAPPIALS